MDYENGLTTQWNIIQPKKKKIRSCAATLMNFENIMPSEISQMLYDSPVRYLKQSNLGKNKVEQCLQWARGRRNGSLFDWYTASVLQDEKVLEICNNSVNIGNVIEMYT